MSPILGNKDDRAAEKAAMQAEIERLYGLSVTDLAAEIFPAWAPGGPGHQPNRGQIAWWLMAAYPRARNSVSTDPLNGPLEEAIQLLEQAGLLLRDITSTGGSIYKLTRLGAAVLANGTARNHLPQRGWA